MKVYCIKCGHVSCYSFCTCAHTPILGLSSGGQCYFLYTQMVMVLSLRNNLVSLNSKIQVS